MATFDEFLNRTKQEEVVKPQGAVIDGSFSCQTCDLDVDEAEYFRVEKILRWKCPEGHISFIEEFLL